MTREKYVTGPMERMLREYARRDPVRLHVPSHKGALSPWDVTELMDTDDLHQPGGAIAAMQADIARRCGAAHSFALVNGATTGVIAMLLALPSTTVLVARDAHKSAVAGVAMAGHEAEFAEVSGVVTPEAVEAAFARAPHAKALLVTSPNYFGQCADVEAIARVAHERGALLLADESHGAHFPYSPKLPPSAGHWADMWVHSAHKTLFALTQGALLHVGARCTDAVPRLQRMLGLIQTSSPSFLLLRSLERAACLAEAADWEGCVNRCAAFRERVDAMPGPHATRGDDPLRLVVDVSKRGWTGVAAARWLHERGIELEMADEARLIGLASPMDKAHWLDAFADALAQLPEQAPQPPHTPPQTAQLPERVMPVREAVFGRSEPVPLARAAGRIAAQAAGQYPPGVALIWPGERIDEACVRSLQRSLAIGAQVFGLTNGEIACVAQTV